MSEFSFNNDDSITNIDIDNILESLNNNNDDEEQNINYFTKKLENDLANYDYIDESFKNTHNKNNIEKFDSINNSKNVSINNSKNDLINNSKNDSNNNFTSKINLLNIIHNSIYKDIFLYTLIFIIINLLFINKTDYKYLYICLKIIIFTATIFIIKKYII